MDNFTDAEIAYAKWTGFSILELSETDYILILLCEDDLRSSMLLQIMATGFRFQIFVNPATKEYSFKMILDCASESITYDTNRSPEIYPPLNWLAENKVNTITTGYKNTQGVIQYNMVDRKPLHLSHSPQ